MSSDGWNWLLLSLDKTDLGEWIGTTPQSLMREVDRGLRRILDL
jgi:mRNA-degrading endonuclease toxin of MazEF toxin-antitoxin module